MKVLSFIVLFALFNSLPVHAKPEVVDRLEAIVNKTPIYQSDLKEFRKTLGLRAKIDPFFAMSGLAKKGTLLDSDILNYKIDEITVVQKFPTNEPELETEVNSIAANLKTDREGLKNAVQLEGFLFSDYLAIMKASLSKRALLDREIRSRAAVTDEDLRNEFKKSKFSSKNFQGSFHLSTIRMQKKNFKSAQLSQEAANAAFQKIEAGVDFDVVARTYSDDPSAGDGGDLGFVSYSDLSPFLQSAVRGLTLNKPSTLLDDKGGQQYYILKITEIRSELDEEFNQQKEALRARLMEDEFQHQIKLWLDRHRATQFIKISAQKTSAPGL